MDSSWNALLATEALLQLLLLPGSPAKNFLRAAMTSGFESMATAALCRNPTLLLFFGVAAEHVDLEPGGVGAGEELKAIAAM